MHSLVESLRSNRKNPSVLKLKILKVRGEDPEILIFIYEGLEDVPVYEEWMRRIAACPRYESIAGAGKQQLTSLLKILDKANDPLLDKIFFFIDRDFDNPFDAHKHVFELDAYSIENLLCTEVVLESILKDEFRKAGLIDERAAAKSAYQRAQDQFYAHSEDFSFSLFCARRCKIAVKRKPEKISEITILTLDSAAPAYTNINEILELERPIDNSTIASLRTEYENLGVQLKHRGKYIIDMFRMWLRLLCAEVQTKAHGIFKEPSQFSGDPAAVNLRRLACAAPLPVGLEAFVKKIALHTK